MALYRGSCRSWRSWRNSTGTTEPHRSRCLREHGEASPTNDQDTINYAHHGGEPSPLRACSQSEAKRYILGGIQANRLLRKPGGPNLMHQQKSGSCAGLRSVTP